MQPNNDVPAAWTAPLSSNAHAARTHRLLTITLVAGLIASLLIVYAVWHRAHSGFPGTLFLTVESWTTAEGAPVTGLVSYQPATDRVMSAVPQRVLPPFLSLPTSPGQLFTEDEVLLMSTGATSSDLVRFSIPAQQILQTLAHVDPSKGELILSPIRSVDGSRIAYSRVVTTSGGTPSTVAYLIAEDGSGATKLGDNTTPLMFSPDGTQLLIGEGAKVSILTIATGERRPLQGVPADFVGSAVRISPDGRFLAIGRPALQVYAVDWINGGLTVSGALENAARASFGPSGKLIVLNGAATIYDLDDGFKKSSSYSVTIPEDAQLNAWLP